MVVLVWIVLLVVSEESIKLYALLEVFDGLHASNMFKEVKVAVDIDACSDETMPVNALQLDVGVILLELERDSLSKVNIWSLDGVHVVTGHLELSKVKVFGENLHIYLFYK